MFFLVAPILSLIPFKSNHAYLHSRKYIVDCQETMLIYPNGSTQVCSFIAFEFFPQKSKSVSQRFDLQSTGDNHKRTLTPYKVNGFGADNAIFLSWKIPENQNYRGVRIFRSEIRSSDKLKEFGKEIYNGAGLQGKVVCSNECQHNITTPPIMKSVAIDLLNLQPPRKTKRLVLAPPIGLKVLGTTEYPEQGYAIYADTTIEPNKAYTYTLFAYDERETFSYPVFINVNTKSQWPFNGCKYEKPPSQ